MPIIHPAPNDSDKETGMKTRLIIMLLSVVGVVLAWQSLVNAAPPGPCFEDRQKFCNDVQPGAGRLYECLEEHEDQLSNACKQHVNAMSEKFSQFADACRNDLAKYCPQVKPGEGRGLACLRGNEDKLTEACRNALAGDTDVE